MTTHTKEMVKIICSFLEAQIQNQELSKKNLEEKKHKTPMIEEELVEIKQLFENERQLLASERQHMVVQAKSMVKATQTFLNLTTSYVQLSNTPIFNDTYKTSL